MTDVAQTVKSMIMEELGVDEENVVEKARFVDDLVIDSMSSVALAVNFEDKFKIDFPEEALDQLKTVGDLIDYIKGKM